MIAIKNRVRMLCREPSAEDLGVFSNRLFNIWEKFKSGKYPVRQMLATLQHVGDGTLIYEEIFSDVFHVVEVDDAPPANFLCLCDLPWVTLNPASSMSDMVFQSLCGYEQFEVKAACGEVFVVSRDVRGDEVLSLLMETAEESNKPESPQAFLKGRDFSPAQLKQMLERGNADADGSAEWTYIHTNFVFCGTLPGCELVFAEVHWDSGKVTVFLMSSIPKFGAGDRLILRSPCCG